MKNKKYLTLKVIHLIFMILGLCYYLYSLYGIKDGHYQAKDVVFIVILTITTVCALISGFIYLIHGYKKNSAAYFKGYVWVILINELFTAVWNIGLSSSYFLKMVCSIELIFLTILTVGKDLGKTRSFTVVGLFFIGKLIMLINSFSYIQAFGSTGISIVLGYAGQIVLAITTGLMVCGKYIDKESRGAK